MKVSMMVPDCVHGVGSQCQGCTLNTDLLVEYHVYSVTMISVTTRTWLVDLRIYKFLVKYSEKLFEVSVWSNVGLNDSKVWISRCPAAMHQDDTSLCLLHDLFNIYIVLCRGTVWPDNCYSIKIDSIYFETITSGNSVIWVVSRVSKSTTCTAARPTKPVERVKNSNCTL
jgi:hypothetical protein